MTVGSVPNTDGPRAARRPASRSTAAATSPSTGCPAPSVPGIYAAGDCTGVLMLASVAAMQGRIAMWHALGEAVAPLRLQDGVAANVFTDPEIATVGVTQRDVDAGEVPAPDDHAAARHQRARQDAGPHRRLREAVLPARRPGMVLGGVVVAPRASELILPISLAVQNGLTVDQLAHTFTIYPSLSGSITEAAASSCSTTTSTRGRLRGIPDSGRAARRRRSRA